MMRNLLLLGLIAILGSCSTVKKMWSYNKYDEESGEWYKVENSLKIYENGYIDFVENTPQTEVYVMICVFFDYSVVSQITGIDSDRLKAIRYGSHADQLELLALGMDDFIYTEKNSTPIDMTDW